MKDRFFNQALDIYQQGIQNLLEKGLHRCYSSEAELKSMRAAQKARGEAPHDNRHRNLTPEQQATFEAEGRRFVIRFKIEDEREIWERHGSWADELARQ